MGRATSIPSFVLALGVALAFSCPAAAAPKQPKEKPGAGKAAPAKKAAAKAKVEAIQVEPAKVLLSGKWAVQRLGVMGRLSDGTLHDLTSGARFKSAGGKIAAVSKAGVVTPVSDGSTRISVSVEGAKKSATVPVTVKDAQNAAASFLNHVRPAISSLGCNSAPCHGAQSGKGGLKLSLFGGEPESDYEALTRSAAGRRINRVEPARSLLLMKATGQIPHQGGPTLQPGSSAYQMLLSWLARGAPWGDPKEPQVVSIKLFPEQPVLHQGDAQQLLATAVFSDGSLRDVTQDAAYQSSDTKVAGVAAGGRLKAEGLGESAIVVSYLRQAAVTRVLMPQPLPEPFPKLPANNKIDELVYVKLKSLGIPPSALCADAEFLRRVYLDVIGMLPTPEEARAFLADSDPRKRSRLIDRLLERDEFADFWAIKWGDLLRIKSEYPVRVWPKAVAVYYRWVRQSIAENKPYDQFARELLTASGSNFRSGPANFFRAVPSKDARTLGETTALIFMGARVGCARCHGHPTERWTLDDDLGMGAFFARLNYKGTSEWKEEIVFPDPRRVLRHPRTREIVKPTLLDGQVVEVGREEDPRPKFADWLTAPQNPWFAANIVNRIWFWLLGRGIVHEPDDLRPTNPPENPELLAYLEKELLAQRYDLKHIFRLILNSRIYQLSSTPNQYNAGDTRHFSHYAVKRLTAEQLLDAISQVTETSERFRSIIPEPFSFWPQGYRASQISDGNTECSFLDMFGRPPRDTPYELERNSEISLRQALYFLNSEQLEGKIAGSPRIKRLLQGNRRDEDTIEELYLIALSRFPAAEEKRTLLDYLAKNKNARGQAVQDMVWAVMNAKEFVFNH